MKFRKILALLLAVVLLSTSVPAAFAQTESTDQWVSEGQPCTNPLYPNLQVQASRLQSAPRLEAADVYYSTIEGAAAVLREGLERRDAEITVGYQTPNGYNSTLFGQIFDAAMVHTGEPTEGDYLLWHWKQRGGYRQTSVQNGITYISFTYEMTYLSSAAQERTMNTAVNNLLQQLNVYNATDYRKITAVYDYMCENITYDYAGLEANTDKTYTAYGALIDHTAVCQGYASLFYRLMLELDVDARLIAGLGNGGPHGWNIVRLGGKYYDVDSTWDASVLSSGQEYQYFLRCEANFGNHVRYDEYKTAAFHQAYPMSTTDYDPSQAPTEPDDPPGGGTPQPPSNSCGDNATWSLSSSGVLYIQGTGAITSAPWKGQDICQVIVEQGITSLCTDAFSDCKQLAAVSLPASLRSIGIGAFSGCTALTNILIPSGVTTIGPRAFANCTYLQTVSIPDSVTAIYEEAFSGCSRLRSIVLPKNLSAIYNKLFYNCSALAEITIPRSVTAIGVNAFYGCNSLYLVHYQGNQSDWSKITISSGNTALDFATIRYAAKNGWYYENDKWYFYEDDQKVTNQWRKDSKGWCWLTADGSMATSTWVKDSKGWCYIEASGYCATNCWKKDSVGWVWLDKEGSMVYNQWILNGGKWYFVDQNGYRVSNQWRKDSKGWCWLTASGAMATSCWIKDSKGWCYIEADGYCATNCFRKDSVGWVWLDKEGSMVYSKWIYNGGKWYYISAKGYRLENTTWNGYKFNASGVCTNP